MVRNHSLCGQSLVLALESSSAASSMDLLIGYEQCSLEPLLSNLLKFSDLLHLYIHIPYFALRCEAGDARSLVGRLDAVGSVSSASFSYGMRSIDLSHEVKSFASRTLPRRARRSGTSSMSGRRMRGSTLTAPASVSR